MLKQAASKSFYRATACSGLKFDLCADQAFTGQRDARLLLQRHRHTGGTAEQPFQVETDQPVAAVASQ